MSAARPHLSNLFKKSGPKSNSFCFFILLALLTSCTTPPTQFEQIKSGQWEVRTTIRQPGEIAKTVMMDVAGMQPSQLRIEVSSSLGIHLASFALNSSKYALALPRQKKFYQGPANTESFRPVLPIRLDPRWIADLLFDRPPHDSSWKCARDKNGFLSACENSADNLRVSWTERERQRRTVIIYSDKAELELQIAGFQPNVQGSSSMFVLARPAGFQLINTSE